MTTLKTRQLDRLRMRRHVREVFDILVSAEKNRVAAARAAGMPELAHRDSALRHIAALLLSVR